MTDRHTDDRPLDEEFEVDPDAHREVAVDDDSDLDAPPPTIDPDERVEAEPDPDIAADGDRPLR
jgi:hypothetical protein